MFTGTDIVKFFQENSALAVFLTVAIGFWIGKFRFGNFSLGIVTSVLLVGVVVGQMNIRIPEPAKTLFFLMFLFSIGYSVGPQFFRGLRKDGLPQVGFAVVVCVMCLLSVWGCAIVMGYDAAQAAGLLAGSQTMSAVIGAATDTIHELPGGRDTDLSVMPVCYAVTYIYGTAGSAWVLGTLGPRLLGGVAKVKQAAKQMESQMGDDMSLSPGFDPAAPESVHLCDYPVCCESRIDPALEDAMEEVLEIVVAGRACRNNAAIKNRQPIGRMYVKAPKEALAEEYAAVIRDELNVKEIVFTQDVRDFTTYIFKPQLRTVGPKYGKLLGKIRAALGELDGNEAMDTLRSGKPLTMEFDQTTVELSEEDLLIESTQKSGFMAETEGELTVVLDTNLSPELLEEGFVREVISKLQTMRKEAGFEVTDHIQVAYWGSEAAEKRILANEAAIAKDVLADHVGKGGSFEGAYEKEWNVNGEKVSFAVKRV